MIMNYSFYLLIGQLIKSDCVERSPLFWFARENFRTAFFLKIRTESRQTKSGQTDTGQIPDSRQTLETIFQKSGQKRDKFGLVGNMRDWLIIFWLFEISKMAIFDKNKTIHFWQKLNIVFNNRLANYLRFFGQKCKFVKKMAFAIFGAKSPIWLKIGYVVKNKISIRMMSTDLIYDQNWPFYGQIEK